MGFLAGPSNGQKPVAPVEDEAEGEFSYWIHGTNGIFSYILWLGGGFKHFLFSPLFG